MKKIILPVGASSQAHPSSKCRARFHRPHHTEKSVYRANRHCDCGGAHFPRAAFAAESVQVQPEMGVTFNQVNFTFVDNEAAGSDTRETTSQALDSNTGEMEVDLAALRAATGFDSGFLNIATAEGWVVQNVPILADFAFPGVVVSFQLAEECCSNVTSLPAAVTFSSDPVASFAGDSFVEFPVGDTELNIGGGNAEDIEQFELDLTPARADEAVSSAGQADPSNPAVQVGVSFGGDPSARRTRPAQLSSLQSAGRDPPVRAAWSASWST